MDDPFYAFALIARFVVTFIVIYAALSVIYMCWFA